MPMPEMPDPAAPADRTPAAPDPMRAAIVRELDAVEAAHGVRVLFACESGSRAWGFASPDSDYDVRFVYVRPRDWYLQLEGGRDVIEWHLDDVLDINGWDVAKLLRLMRSSNPTVFEWLASPIVYREDDAFAPVRALASQVFQPQPGVHHYLHMAQNNTRDFLHGDTVRLKKYLYVIRPLLAARWILDERTAPPMRFSDLAAAKLDTSVRPLVDALVAEKMRTGELGERPRIDALNAWIDVQSARIADEAVQLPHLDKPDWQPLNEVFLRLLS